PDFNQRITEYQVDHVTGQISGTEYSPPKCEVLRSNHVCYWGEDKLCHQEWLRHPLQYYAVKKKSNSKKASSQSS
ncbi:MAG: DNA primase, partial [Candidatus Thermoplasmatota archaeon]|nr:DNA primase [Candidatus Thermoplasmatota archaeon]